MNYKINIQWKYGQLISAEIFVPKGSELPPLKLNNKELDKRDSRVRIQYQ